MASLRDIMALQNIYENAGRSKRQRNPNSDKIVMEAMKLARENKALQNRPEMTGAVEVPTNDVKPPNGVWVAGETKKYNIPGIGNISAPQIDIYEKIYTLRQEMEKLEKQEQQAKVQDNIWKAMGFLPNSEEENNATRDVVMSAAEAEDTDNSMSPRTNESKLRELIDNVQLSLGGTLSDPKVKIGTKAKKQTSSDRDKQRKMAIDVAKRIHIQEYEEAKGSELDAYEQENLENYQPTLDEIEAVMPLVEKYRSGKIGSINEGLKNRAKKTPKITNKEKPGQIDSNSSEYRVGTIYEDADGKRAEYMGGGKWQMA